MQIRRALIVVLLAAVFGAASAAERRYMSINRAWEVLPAPDVSGTRATLAAAARALGERRILLAGVPVTAQTLSDLAATPPEAPLVRAVRERLRRPVDLPDFLLLLDDVARGTRDDTAGDVHLPSGRARGAGILLHPDDVFHGEPRHYGRRARLAVTQPPRPADLPPAANGTPPGPRWTARYRNPFEEDAMLDALRDAGGGDFAARIESLLTQLREQGADAYLFSTVRRRERGYLIYGSFILSRARDEAAVNRRVKKLERLNREWRLDVPIRWRHPDGWRATREGARAMASAYNVVYATERGARHSSHYGASAADFAGMALPRRLTLAAPDGARRTFDLSAPNHPRDLNLAPHLITWVERHFGFAKHRGDYPHWTDTASRQQD